MKHDENSRLGLDLTALRTDDYGEHTRSQLFDLIDRRMGSVLDIGCAGGIGAPAMRSRGAVRLVGIELDVDYAKAASARYDEVVTGSVEDSLPWPPGSFDTVLCYDVLEHTYDPWSILRRIQTLIKPHGRLHISIPNTRSIDFWRPLLLRGTFGYEPAGLRDVTHIRFFTRRDLANTVRAAGFEVLRIDSIGQLSRKQRLAIAATAGRGIEFFAYQWALLARPLPHG